MVNIAASAARPDKDNVGIAIVPVTVAVAVLFARFVSGVAAVTVAVFDVTPSVGGIVNVSSTVADAPDARVPSEHVTVVAPAQLP